MKVFAAALLSAAQAIDMQAATEQYNEPTYSYVQDNHYDSPQSTFYEAPKPAFVWDFSKIYDAAQEVYFGTDSESDIAGMASSHEEESVAGRTFDSSSAGTDTDLNTSISSSYSGSRASDSNSISSGSDHSCSDSDLPCDGDQVHTLDLGTDPHHHAT